uniref:Uncharacterized protein n=1 Tax=Nelumbo nucifera TaxID=4432 RepID=A0A822XVT3_NELNU|nr:TPA_asm: hypothetical protein HUJ06_024662 [Nelumbo nucifera]
MDDLHSSVSWLRRLDFEPNIEIGVNTRKIPFHIGVNSAVVDLSGGISYASMASAVGLKRTWSRVMICKV